MNAESELKEYLTNIDIGDPDMHIEPIIRLVLMVLSEQRPSPKRFSVIPNGPFEMLKKYQESEIIGQFPLPVSIDDLAPALQMLSAGICITTPDVVIIPYPLLILTRS